MNFQSFSINIADWLLFFGALLQIHTRGDERTDTNNTVPSIIGENEDLRQFSHKNYKLQDLHYFLIGATIISYVTYIGIGGFLHVRHQISLYKFTTGHYFILNCGSRQVL